MPLKSGFLRFRILKKMDSHLLRTKAATGTFQQEKSPDMARSRHRQDKHEKHDIPRMVRIWPFLALFIESYADCEGGAALTVSLLAFDTGTA